MTYFVAVRLPGFVVADLATAQSALPPALSAGHPDLRWTPPQNWHLTLAFLGEVSVPRLADLERLGYVDDARFAKTKAMSAAQYKHHGHRRARVELMKAGVDDATARKAIEDVYDPHDSLGVARTLAQKQAPRLRKLDPIVARRRLAGMLARRGFDYDTIRPVIDEVLGYGDERGTGE